MNPVLRRLNLWTLDRLSRDTGWLTVPRTKRATWAGVLIAETTVSSFLIAFVFSALGPAAGWAVAGAILVGFVAFVWQLAVNPVRTLRSAPEVGLWITVALGAMALLAGYVRACCS